MLVSAHYLQLLIGLHDLSLCFDWIKSLRHILFIYVIVFLHVAILYMDGQLWVVISLVPDNFFEILLHIASRTRCFCVLCHFGVNRVIFVDCKWVKMKVCLSQSSNRCNFLLFNRTPYLFISLYLWRRALSFDTRLVVLCSVVRSWFGWVTFACSHLWLSRVVQSAQFCCTLPSGRLRPTRWYLNCQDRAVFARVIRVRLTSCLRILPIFTLLNLSVVSFTGITAEWVTVIGMPYMVLW